MKILPMGFGAHESGILGIRDMVIRINAAAVESDDERAPPVIINPRQI